jgi:hypothetical protein
VSHCPAHCRRRNTALTLKTEKLIAFVLVLSLFTGCSWSGVNRQADGSWAAWNLRFAWQTAGFEVMHSTNTVTVRLTRSNGDAATAGAIAEGVARGMK